MRGPAARVWMWSVIPQSAKDFGADTWENESWKITGHANVWGPMTLDEARGLLYLGTSTPGQRLLRRPAAGANDRRNRSLLDANTGKRKWSFPGRVHHGLWDYDSGAAESGHDHR